MWGGGGALHVEDHGSPIKEKKGFASSSNERSNSWLCHKPPTFGRGRTQVPFAGL